MTPLALATLLAYLTLNERVALGRAPGFPGLPVLEPVFIVAAVAAWLAAGRPRPTVPGGWVVTVGPLFALLIALPLLGVLLGTYGPTSLYSWTVVLVPLAVLALVATAPARTLVVCHAAIVVHGGYALTQALFRVGLVPPSVGQPLRQWDVETQRSLSEAYVIIGRSTGLFVNANTFGLWAVVSLVFSYACLRGWRRHSGVALAVVSIISSQSRTAIVCLLLLGMIWLVLSLRDSVALSRLALRAVVFGLPVVLVSDVLGVFDQLLEGRLVERLASGAAVLEEGVQADSNLLGRLEAWRSAWDFAPMDPRLGFGTLGPPLVHFEGVIDNQFVAFYLQGGLVLVGAFLLALLSPWTLRHRGVRQVGPLAVVCAVVALESLTLTPVFTTQALSLVWVVAGPALQASSPAPDPVPDPAKRAGDVSQARPPVPSRLP
ncbi:O-antigen ligase family protein [Ornithinimicrobium pekingense]|uniref:O-antigen ligase-related domain-containing protein n=1 Tax=Ornithinimicrobium pekingense TaxID=384677 RepID=A0ABQ2F974_9MICO|nr:O-antigen ligase family protein [Ornithinimicrobium pekingense]GGK71107.1 hypothetical protein GCM10011509_19420 [Ornithinimicrobium pekingense]